MHRDLSSSASRTEDIIFGGVIFSHRKSSSHLKTVVRVTLRYKCNTHGTIKLYDRYNRGWTLSAELCFELSDGWSVNFDARAIRLIV